MESWLGGFEPNKWSFLSGLLPSPPREGWALPDRSLAKSSHYSFSVTASWKPTSPWDLAKSQGWNVKFSNSGICSTTLSQHTDFSKGIAGYQPLSEGALYTRLALVLAGRMAQTGGNTATTAHLPRDEGHCSYRSQMRELTLQLPTVHLTGLNPRAALKTGA